MAELAWVNLGHHAVGIVDDDRLDAVVYWQPFDIEKYRAHNGNVDLTDPQRSG